MSKQASKTAIGAFVLGALALVIIALVVFGKGAFFTKKLKHVLFFQGSVKGLQVGSPVLFRGVTVGQVTDIALWFRARDLKFVIPVYIEIEPEKISVAGGTEGMTEGTSLLGPLIEKGFKGQLQMQSFVTGQLVVNLDFYPETPVKLLGLEKRYPEIPTVATNLELLEKRLTEVDLGMIATKLERTLDSVEKLVSSKELRGSIVALEQTLASIEKLSRNLDAKMDPLSSEMQATLQSTRKAIESFDKTVVSYKDLAKQNQSLGYDVHKTMTEMQALSRSLRSFVDYLDRHPEALVRGKAPSKGDMK